MISRNDINNDNNHYEIQSFHLSNLDLAYYDAQMI